MQFPILPPPQGSPVASMPSVPVAVSARIAFADVLAALRGAPSAAKIGSGEATGTAMQEKADSPGPGQDDGVAVLTEAGVAPDGDTVSGKAGQTDPDPETAEDPGADGAAVHIRSQAPIPVPTRVAIDKPITSDGPVLIGVPLPEARAATVVPPERTAPAEALPHGQRDGQSQVSLPQGRPEPGELSSLPLSRVLRDVAAPMAADGRVPPPAPDVPPRPPVATASAGPVVPTAPVLSPPPVPLSEGEDVALLRPDTGLVSGAAPGVAEGVRPAAAVPAAVAVTSQAVAAQIAVALGRSADGTIDISLHPQELGRLRLSLSPTESGLVVTIAAERPETLDLLRRHAADLGQDLRDLGFHDVDLNFGGAGPDQFRGQLVSGTDEEAAFAPSDRPSQVLSPSAPILQVVGGLDIRL